jgi:alginate O-acetyltransferase complex protein AlgI
MLFNSFVFWVFFGVFWIGYWALHGNRRNAWSLVASYVFYGWWDWRFLGLIIFLTILNYWFGLEIAKDQAGERTRHRWIVASVTASLAILGFFKYFNFFVASARSSLIALGLTPAQGTLEIILPIGISFYTFQAMSYTIDLYRREIEVERSFIRFATFMAFFPQLVAGPIVRASDFLPQLRRDAQFSWSALVEGACMVAWGMVLKVVVADSLAPVVDARFFAPEAMSSLSLLIGVVSYTFQIYGDFAGYSLMAIGFARSMGYVFHRNFDRPYFASSFSEFWKRWHISLSSWLRDYLYIPLGGNRMGPFRTYTRSIIWLRKFKTGNSLLESPGSIIG